MQHVMNKLLFCWCVSFFYYRPQRSWAKVIFSQTCVKNSVHTGGVWGCLPQCMLGYTPRPAGRPPLEQTPPRTKHVSRILSTWGGRVSASVHAEIHPPDQADPPRSRQIPPKQTPPSREADSSIRSTSGRYASYWNAFLLLLRGIMLCSWVKSGAVRYHSCEITGTFGHVNVFNR